MRLDQNIIHRWKKALFCIPKVHTFIKFAAVPSAVKLFLAALCAAQHGLYTSNLLPTPMNKLLLFVDIQSHIPTSEMS